MNDVTPEMLLGEIKALGMQVSAVNDKGDERHEQRMIWQQGHDKTHVSLAKDLRELKTDVDKGKGAIVAFGATGALIVALSGLIGGFWTYLTKTGQI